MGRQDEANRCYVLTCRKLENQYQFPMLLISQAQIWFIHTCDLDMLRHGYSIATYKPEEPAWITVLNNVQEVAGRLCVFPFTHSMNNSC